MSGQFFGKLCGTVFHRRPASMVADVWCGIEAKTLQQSEIEFIARLTVVK